MTSSESNRHAVPIAKAGDAYKIERLEREVKDLRARLQMAEAERDRFAHLSCYNVCKSETQVANIVSYLQDYYGL